MESIKRFPLSQILKLYYKRPEKMYLNYFRELKLLKDWLGPFDLEAPEFEIPRIPFYLRTYELQEVAKLFSCSQELIKYHLDRIHDEQCRHR